MSEENYRKVQKKRAEENFDSDDEEAVSSKKKARPTPTAAQKKRIDECFDSDDEEAGSSKKKARLTAAQKKRVEETCDSEEEAVSTKKKAKPAPKKTTKSAKEKGKAESWLYSDAEDNDEQVRPKKVQPTCVFSRRVAGGTVRRTANLSGDLLTEIRIYNPDEVRNLEGYERCDKAVIWMRYQGDSSSPELVALKQFVKLAKTKFTEEGTFFSSKSKK